MTNSKRYAKEGDREPRFVWREGIAFLRHPCCVCGDLDASFGYGVSIRNDRLGTWYCFEHKPAETKPQTAS